MGIILAAGHILGWVIIAVKAFCTIVHILRFDDVIYIYKRDYRDAYKIAAAIDIFGAILAITEIIVLVVLLI